MNVYVAPIEDELLLGLDFLRTYGVSLDLRNETLRIDQEVIAMTTGLTHNTPAVARVKVAKRIVVPHKLHGSFAVRFGGNYGPVHRRVW